MRGKVRVEMELILVTNIDVDLFAKKDDA